MNKYTLENFKNYANDFFAYVDTINYFLNDTKDFIVEEEENTFVFISDNHEIYTCIDKSELTKEEIRIIKEVYKNRG